MSRAKFIEGFLSAIDSQSPVEASMDTQLEDLPEWDSLAAFGVIVMFDMEHGKITTGGNLIKARTVGDLYQIFGL